MEAVKYLLQDKTAKKGELAKMKKGLLADGWRTDSNLPKVGVLHFRQDRWLCGALAVLVWQSKELTQMQHVKKEWVMSGNLNVLVFVCQKVGTKYAACQTPFFG